MAMEPAFTCDPLKGGQMAKNQAKKGSAARIALANCPLLRGLLL